MQNSNLQNIKNILLAVLFIIVLFLSYDTVNVRYDLKESEINYKVSQDSLRETKNKLGESIYSKSIYIKSIEELKQENNSLNEEIKKLSYSEKSKLIEIQKLQIIINNLKDSALQELDSSFICENQYKYNFLIQDQYRTLEGYNIIYSETQPDSSSIHIEKEQMNVDLTITKKDTKNGIELGVSSNNPYLSINNIEGSIVDIEAYKKYQKPKKWGLGVGVGLGLGYDLINKSIFIGPTVAVSLNYNFLTW